MDVGCGSQTTPKKGNDVKACRDWVKGRGCRFGDKCKFAHPPVLQETHVQGDRSKTIKQIRYLENFTSSRYQLDGEHNMALLIQDAFNLLDDDVVWVATCLARPERCGLQCIYDIAHTHPSVHPSGRKSQRGEEVSFTRVTVPLLRFLSDQRFMYTVTHLTNPVISTAITGLDFEGIKGCLSEIRQAYRGRLPKTCGLRDTAKEAALWKPASWACVVLYVSKFLHLVTTRFETLYQLKSELVLACGEQLEAMLTCPDMVQVSQNQKIPALHAFKLFKSCLEQKRRLKEWAEDLKGKRSSVMAEQQHTQSLNQASRNQLSLVGPGNQRPEGPRHSNDHEKISDIDIVPPQDEILCQIPPYLPPNLAGAAKHLPSGPNAHIDTLFRLMRHDILSSLFTSVGVWVDDSNHRETGGRVQFSNGSFLWSFNNASVINVQTDRKVGVYFEVEFDPLEHLGNQSLSNQRQFWERSRRLSHGTLVCLVIEVDDDIKLITGVICERNIESLVPRKKGRPSIGISFPERHNQHNTNRPEYALVWRLLRNGDRGTLLQSSGSFFAYQPFLKALQRMEEVPLAEFLIPAMPAEKSESTLEDDLRIQTKINTADQSIYLQLSEKINLKVLIDKAREGLLPSDQADQLRHLLSSVSLDEHAFPYEALGKLTTLNASQCQALRASLFQRVSLIQGPPGTGKTFLALQVMRVLLANRKPRDPPILVICLTNHAIDQFLEGVLSFGEENVVRVGNRSKSEKLEQYNLKNLKMGISRARGDSIELKRLYKAVEKLQKEIATSYQQLNSLKHVQSTSWAALEEIIMISSPALFKGFESFMKSYDDDGYQLANGEPEQVWKCWARGKPRPVPRSVEELCQQLSDADGKKGIVQANQFEKLMEDESFKEDGDEVELEGGAPEATSSALQKLQNFAPEHATLMELLAWKDIWGLTKSQRHKLIKHWSALQVEELLAVLENQQTSLSRLIWELNEVHQNASRDVLRSAHVIGMTTAGVASAQSLLSSLSPRIVLVEEAAEVLEAHILCGMAPSVQQLILIGDHLQLRPKVETYDLSMASKKGYNLDLSLFERLVCQRNLPMVILEEQHRMRPEISSLIRGTVYKNLLDHPRVLSYGDVPGMTHNLYWIAHNEPESGDQEGISKSNVFEAQFATKLVRYLVQQGSGIVQNSITVLTGYLGQLVLLKKELSKHFCVCLGEKDESEIADLQETLGEDSNMDVMSLHDAVRLATVDNFQGEESDIVILSLVRSNPNTIGFLRAITRSNVALSRAKRGLYIIGNAECLGSSKAAKDVGFWPSIIEKLESMDCIGPSLSLRCQNHPEAITHVSKPEDFDRLVSDGGCSIKCTQRLPCGHSCPQMCHPTDAGQHKYVRCPAPCMRLLDCGHPCSKACGDRCGPCMEIVAEVQLPCGHIAYNLHCHKATNTSTFKCLEEVEVTMLRCGHKLRVACSSKQNFLDNPHTCHHPCSAILPCQHECAGVCGECFKKDENSGIDIVKHRKCKMPCKRQLMCGHECSENCHEVTVDGRKQYCPPCSKPCAAVCEHSKCTKSCSQPCMPCTEPCGWSCIHQGRCLLPCGAPCLRVPCDERCNKNLPCGHRCPCVCGELCPDPSYCIVCGNKLVYDVILAEERCVKDYSEEEVSEDPFIVLLCGHVFPISSMDEIMELERKERSISSVPSLVESNSAEPSTEVRGAYCRGPDGRWLEANQLPARMEGAKNCILCRDTIKGIRRYGRQINKHALEEADRKMSSHANEKLAIFQKHLSSLDEELANAFEGISKLKQPLEALKDLAKAIYAAAASLADDIANPPSLYVYDASKVNIMRAMGEYKLKGEISLDDNGGDILALTMAQPDRTPYLRAASLAANATVKSFQLLLISAIHPEKALPRVRGEASKTQSNRGDFYKMVATTMFALENQALHWISTGKQLADETQSLMSKAKILIIEIDLYIHIHRLLDTMTENAIANELPLEMRTAIVQRHENAESILKEAEGLCSESEAIAKQVLGGHGLENFLKGITARKEWIHAKKQHGVITIEEQRMVYQVLMSSSLNADLQRIGTPSDHFYTCPNGHVYIVGNCGMAMEVSWCPECGALIGWSSHTLRSDNRVADEFLRVVQT